MEAEEKCYTDIDDLESQEVKQVELATEMQTQAIDLEVQVKSLKAAAKEIMEKVLAIIREGDDGLELEDGSHWSLVTTKGRTKEKDFIHNLVKADVDLKLIEKCKANAQGKSSTSPRYYSKCNSD